MLVNWAEYHAFVSKDEPIMLMKMKDSKAHLGNENHRKVLIMYYIIEHKYVGPNQNSDQFIDASRIEISTTPATTNSSYVERIEGWCGTTNDWAVYAHGEYETTELAKQAITKKLGRVRDVDPNGDDFLSCDENVVEVFKLGKYEPMSYQATADWAHASMLVDINADSTDERIDVLAAIYECEANSEGYTLDSDLEESMKAYRDELKEELALK